MAAPVFYQGSDWTTQRRAVAQAYDTLERICDLCHSRTGLRASEGAATALKGIISLCDNLAAELAFIEAELTSVTQDYAAPRWTAFEMRHYLGSIREQAGRQKGNPPPPFFPALLALAGRLKAALKRMDQ